MEDPLKIYLDLVLDTNNRDLGLGIQPFIPQSYKDTYTKAEQILSSQHFSREELEIRAQIGDIFRTTTKKFGAFTEKAKLNLQHFEERGGSVEIGHQPKFLGGERFLINKLVCGGLIQNYTPDFVPFLFIGDYDKVHGELIKTKIPVVNSATGISLSVAKNVEAAYQEGSIRCLPKPTEAYLRKILEKIRSSYQFSFQEITTQPFEAQVMGERVEQAIQKIWAAFHASDTYGGWFGHLVSNLTNIACDYGMMFIQASDPSLQRLMLPHYEALLRERQKYVSIYQDLFNVFESNGYSSPLRPVSNDFVPFFVECPQDHCHGRRILLHAKEESGRIVLEGTCESCNMPILMETAAAHPDLSEWYTRLTPRVDSRQFLVSSTIQPQIHIAGTGETRYYMMDLPLLYRFKPEIQLPIIYFYNKVTFNTAFTRYLEEPLKAIPEYFPLLKSLMKNIGKLKKLAKKPDVPDQFQARWEKCLQLLSENKETMGKIQNACEDAAAEGEFPPEVIQNAIPAYLANFFGEISRERSGQEAVFHWIDLVVKNGIGALDQDYQLVYRPWQTPGLPVQL